MTYTPPSGIKVRAQPYLNLRAEPAVGAGNIIARLADGSTWPVVGVAHENFDAQADVLWAQIEFTDPATSQKSIGFCHSDFLDPIVDPLPAAQQVLPSVGLNLRSSPAFDITVNNKILTMPGGSIVRVLGGAWENLDPNIGKWWFFVEYEGQRGYAYARFLGNPAGEMIVTKGLQAGAPMGNNGEIFFTIPVAAKIAESGAGWVRINFRLGPRFQDWTETTTFGFSALSRYDIIIDNALSNNLKVLGLLSNFAWLLRRVYVAARDSGVPNLAVVCGGLHSTHGPDAPALTPANTGADYLSATYNQGRLNAGWETIKSTYGSYPLDVIGQHLYIDQWGRARASRIEQAVQLVHDAYLAEEGGSTTKTTHVTEMGWSTNRVSESVQAGNLKTAYTRLKRLAYTPRTYWFFLQDEPAANLFHGLLRGDGSEKPSWNAYRTVN